MIAIDQTPLAQVDIHDLLAELRMRATEPQVLGVRTRIDAIESEIVRRVDDADDACPDDPDGLHHVACGCDTSDVFA